MVIKFQLYNWLYTKILWNASQTMIQLQNAKDNFLPIYLILKFTMNVNEGWHGTL